MLFLQKMGVRLYTFFSSNSFFYLTLAIFSLGVIWMITASIYPMAFDEEFHWGLIQIFATGLTPYGIEHTPDMAQYGAATADPSYLFHYLMSWPYRILDALQLPDTAIVIVLRFINLALLIIALFVYKKAFQRAGISSIVTNASVALFLFIPTFSMLAAQINYDSLLILIVAICLLLTVTISNHALKTGKLLAKETWLLALTVLIGIPVKYAFLPLAAGFFIWVVILVVVIGRKFNYSLQKQIVSFTNSTRKLSAKAKIWLSIFGVIGLFFAAHYATNYVSYGSPLPKCDAVFDKEACKAYGPWNRNQNYMRSLSPSFEPVSYPAYMATEWLPGMTIRLTFALAGKTNGFQTKPPLLLVIGSFVTLTILGVGLIIWRFIYARLTITPLIWITLLLCLIYCGVLSVQLYNSYIETGVPVAINGRYLLPLLPILGVVMIDSAAVALKRVSSQIKSFAFASILIFFLITGAGWTTYIVLSEPHWFWQGWGQNSQAVLQPLLDALTIKLSR